MEQRVSGPVNADPHAEKRVDWSTNVALAATAAASLSGCGCSLRLYGCSLSHEPECMLCLHPIYGISAGSRRLTVVDAAGWTT